MNEQQSQPPDKPPATTPDALQPLASEQPASESLTSESLTSESLTSESLTSESPLTHSTLSYSDSPTVNPYAPTSITAANGLASSSPINLPGSFWLALLAAGLAVIACVYYMPPLGLLAGVGLALGAIRVPLMQRQPSPLGTPRQLPAPPFLLGTSWIFMTVAVLASCISFVVICVPSGAATMSLTNSEAALPFIFGLSGILSLAVLIFLLRLSLKLPV